MQALFARTRRHFGELLPICELFCFPQGESHLDRVSVHSHVVTHVNSFTESALRHVSHGEKCEVWQGVQ